MVYRVSTVDDDLNSHIWWKNFFVMRMQSGRPINDLLSKYHATNALNSWDIEFETEEDFLVFRLKFG